jgi:hypothetical protein
MRWMRALVASLLIAALHAAPARACEPSDDSESTTVVGFDAAGDVALLRVVMGDSKAIELRLYDLAHQKTIERLPILTPEDPEPKRAALRGKRWKAAEADLRKRGFRILPEHPFVPGPPFDLGGGLQLVAAERDDPPHKEDEDDEALATERKVITDLKIQKGDREAVAAGGLLVESSLTSGYDRTRLQGGYFTPSRRYLMLLGGACESSVLFVLDVPKAIEALQKESPPAAADAGTR